MNVYRYVASNSFMFAALFCNFASDNDNDKQSVSEKEIKQLEEKLTSLEGKLQELSNKKLELQKQEVDKKQYFENQIQELKEKNTEELDKITKENNDSIAAKEEQLTLLHKESENAEDDNKKKEIAKKIKEAESVINKLKNKASKQENGLHNKQEKEIFDLGWKKEKELLNLKLEDLDCDIEIAKVNEDIRVVSERLSRLKNSTDGHRLKKQDHVSKSAPVLGGASTGKEKKDSSLKQKIKEIEEKKSKLKLDFDLQKKMSVLEREIGELRGKIASLESSFLKDEEKIKIEIDKELHVALQKKTDDFEKKRKRSIQKKEGEINTINEKISSLNTALDSETDNQRKENLNKEKIVLSGKVKVLTDEIASLQKNDVLDKELESLKKDSEEKKQFLLKLQKKDIDEKWKALGRLVRKKKFLSDQVDYLGGHSLADYKKWYKNKVLEASSVSIIGSGNSTWDLQKDLDDAVKAKQEQTEKTQNDMLEKNGYTRNQHIVAIDSPQKDDDKEEDSDDKKLKLSDVVSFSTLKTSARLPKLWIGKLPVSFSGEGTLDFNFNKLYEDKNYKKFSVKVKVGLPKINVLPTSSEKGSGGDSIELHEESPSIGGSEAEKDFVEKIVGGDTCSLISCGLPPEQKYSPLGKHLFLRELVVSWAPGWVGFCKVAIKGGFRTDSLGLFGEVSSSFLSTKFTSINDIVFFKCRISKYVRVGSLWNPYKSLLTPTGYVVGGVKTTHFFISFGDVVNIPHVGRVKLKIGLRDLPWYIDLVRFRTIVYKMQVFSDGRMLGKDGTDDIKIRMKIPCLSFLNLKIKSLGFSLKCGRDLSNINKKGKKINAGGMENKFFVVIKGLVFDFACPDMWWAKQIGLEKLSFDCCKLEFRFSGDGSTLRFLKFKATFKQGFSFACAPIQLSGGFSGPSFEGSWNILDYIDYRKANKKKTANTDF